MARKTRHTKAGIPRSRSRYTRRRRRAFALPLRVYMRAEHPSVGRITRRMRNATGHPLQRGSVVMADYRSEGGPLALVVRVVDFNRSTDPPEMLIVQHDAAVNEIVECEVLPGRYVNLS